MEARASADKLLGAAASEVRSVSEARAKLLAKLGIETVGDLLASYPHRYIDLTCLVSCASAPIGSQATVVGSVFEVKEKTPRPRLSILEVSLVDESGVLIGVWFRQPWMRDRFEPGMRVAFSGKVEFSFGFKRMNAPVVEFLGDSDDAPSLGLLPVHPATEGLSTTWMRRFVANALELCADISDTLPVDLRRKRALLSRKRAMRDIHFPASKEALSRAHRRLAYEEALCLQLEMMMRRDAETRGRPAHEHVAGPATKALAEALPFSLTPGQQAAIDDIAADMGAKRCMSRMLLGDVGCGKTVVAAFAIALCADSHTQAAMMAPTSVLARQYASRLGSLFDAAGITHATLTGATPAAERTDILARLADGSLTCVFGTHALIEPDVAFADLSLAVIDEQHRFGVRQRSALRAKGTGTDLLVMTATPIPRTLALALYGDLETSFILDRPQTRPATTTRVISRNERGVAYDAIRDAVASGRQAYIICPLVGLTREQREASAADGSLGASLSGQTDIADPKAAASERDFLAAKVFPEYTVGLLTGHMGSAEKQQAMDAFARGETDILVATTVVEVGVDVANATVMLVEDGERFGLSQLHQLRGRIGRGEFPGSFFVVADPGKDDEELRARLDAIANCDNGFELAEADLKARREGDVLGSRQHGAAALKLVNVIDDAELIGLAHDDAREILDADPRLENPCHAGLLRELSSMFDKGQGEDELAGGSSPCAS